MKESNNSGMGFSRRSFLKTMGAAAAFTVAPSSILGKSVSGQNAPSDMVNVCGIGVGSQGGSDIRNMCTPDEEVKRGVGYPNTSVSGRYAGLQPARQERIVVNQLGSAAQQKIKECNIYALCDVDHEYSGHILNAYPNAKKFTDWHKVMEDKNIDAVVIGTPDHNHAIIAANAMLSGKHVFVEKPMAKTVYECRYLTKLAQMTGKVTQMGNQGHNMEGGYLAKEWIAAGTIGTVTDLYMWSNRPIWRQGYYNRPTPEAVPANLDYDTWLGPAAMKSYHSETTHFNWRGLWDYGTGALGDMGAHTIDAPLMALNLGLPTKIQATSTPFNDEYIPQSEYVKYEFKPNGKDPINVVWSDGGIKPFRPKELEAGRALQEVLYVGSKGMMMQSVYNAVPQLVPERPDWTQPAKTEKRPMGNIYVDFIDAIKNNRKANNDFSHAAKLTEIMLLTNVAVMSQQMNTILEYDAAKMRITNLPEANEFLHYEYRTGWELPQTNKVLPIRHTEKGWELA